MTSLDDAAPTPPESASLDQLAAALDDLRAWAGTPSFTQIAHDVHRTRRARGVPAAEARTARSTIYDCFRPGRRRVDTDLVLDVVEALAPGGMARRAWTTPVRRAAAAANLTGPDVTSLHAGEPETLHDRLVGREEETRRLVESSRSCVVVGLAGVGKSALVDHVARVLLDRGHVDACLRVSLDGFTPQRRPAHPEAIVDTLVARLYDGQVPRGERRELLARALRERRVLLLLDNAADADQITSVIPLPPGPSRALVTSRLSLDLPHAETLTLAPLGGAPAVELLARSGGVEVREEEAEAWTKLAELAGGLPLALRLAGARIASTSGWSLQDQLDAQRSRLQMLHLEAGVEGALQMSYDALPAEHRLALRLLAQAPLSTLDRPAAAALTDIPLADLDLVLDSLATAHLVESLPDGFLGLHDLVRVLAVRRSVEEDPPSRVQQARERLLEHVVAHLTSAVALVYPSAPPAWFWLDAPPAALPHGPACEADAVAWLTRHRDEAVVMAGWAAEHGYDVHLCHLEGPLAMALWDQGDLDTAAALITASLAAAERRHDARARAFLHRHLAQTLIGAGRLEEAMEASQDAVAAHAALGDADGEALSRVALAKVLCDRDEIDGAIEQTDRALAHFGTRPDRGEHLQALRFDLAGYHYQQDHPADAEPILDLVIKEAAAGGWPVQEMWARNLLAVVLIDLDRPEEAEAHIDRALELAAARDNPRAVLLCEANRILVLQGLGRATECLRAGEAALARAAELDLPEATHSVHEMIGRAALSADRHEQARHHLEIARELARSCGDLASVRHIEAWLRSLPDVV